jgi:hypothetical protein
MLCGLQCLEDGPTGIRIVAHLNETDSYGTKFPNLPCICGCVRKKFEPAANVGVATFAFTKWPSRERQREPSGGRNKFYNIAAVQLFTSPWEL